MKTGILVLAAAVVLGAAVVCLHRPSPPPAAAPAASVVEVKEEAPPSPVALPPESRPESVVSALAVVPAPAVVEEKPADPRAAALAKAMDLLVSPQAELAEKRATWKQLREAGQLDAAIAELKERAQKNPGAAEYPTTLAEAYLNKIPDVTNQNERAILAMQADGSFDEALRADPSHWEAQFMKASALSHWPDFLGKGPEVIQRLTDLINQQETQTPQPRFVESYVLLGDQYQKSGNAQYAKAVWQAGAALFPGDATLQKKIAGARQ